MDFLKKAVTIQWSPSKKKDLLLLAIKLIENIPDPRIVKDQSTIIKKNRKSVKQSEIITY